MCARCAVLEAALAPLADVPLPEDYRPDVAGDELIADMPSIFAKGSITNRHVRVARAALLSARGEA